MDPRTYGAPPYRIVVCHGGPGAPGDMAPVARDLSAAGLGVLEPFQSGMSVAAQVAELAAVIRGQAEPPVTLIGFSWGAHLVYLTAAAHPDLVRKLVVVSSGPFTAEDAETIRRVRLERLSVTDRARAEELRVLLADPAAPDADERLAELARLYSKADNYDTIGPNTEVLEVQAALHRAVNDDARAIRASGELLRAGERITCPVLAINGDYDPHPAEGIRRPLSEAVKDFRFVLLERCGHYPWLERHARDEFFALLREEVA